MKKIIFFGIAILSFSLVYAQESEEQKIELPEISTVVEGDSLVAGKDSVPDFSKVIPPMSKGELMPKLPGVEVFSGAEELEADLSYGEQKNIYAQGLIGGGIPGDFVGDFSVYQNTGKDPFKIEFSHVNENGYGSHLAGDGFFDNTTFLNVEKDFNLSSCDIGFNAGYEKINNGLQDQSDIFYDMNRLTCDGGFAVKKSFTNGVLIGGNINGSYYTRYSGMKDDSVEILAQEEKSNIVFINPAVFIGWSNDAFGARFDSGFNWQTFAGDFDTIDEVKEFPDYKNVVRGNFDLSGTWKNEVFDTKVRAGIVAGSQNGGLPVIPVFDVSAKASWKMGSALKNYSVKLSGGLESEMNLVSDLEKKYKYSSLLFLPSETSDWFADLEFNVPVTSRITVDGRMNYKATAFDNGIWEADYLNALDSGIYTFDYDDTDRYMFNSNVGFSYIVNSFLIRIYWDRQWIHVPSSEFETVLGASVVYDNDETKWRFSADIFEVLDKDADKVPVLDLGVSYKVRNLILLNLSVTDTIKLLSGNDRNYLDTDYLVRAGGALFSVKFFF